ncbi:MAG: FtsQ-type POTRA domain-containing protein [Microbacteriaceae bacterium]|nr:FtsQ-type POTRA domain-containing protein [Microbacteriaceae bacterium]
MSSNADQVRAASARAERGSRALLASAVGRRATVRVGSRLGAGVSTMESATAVRDRGPNPEKAARKILRQKTRERRRFEKSEVRRFTRRSRHRRAALATTGGVIVVMATLLVIAVYSPLLALKQINIVGASRLDSTRILDVVDGQLHTPLALVDFDRITRELGTFPLIRSYVTEIVPPDTLTIRLVERAPIGAIAVVDGYEIVDPAGVVIEKSGARLPKIPLIDIGGQKPDSAAFRAAVEVLLALPPTVAAELDTVTASSTDNVNLSLAGGGAKILWGSADRSAYKARVLSAVLAKNYPNVTEYNVSAPGQLTYR